MENRERRGFLLLSADQEQIGEHAVSSEVTLWGGILDTSCVCVCV